MVIDIKLQEGAGIAEGVASFVIAENDSIKLTFENQSRAKFDELVLAVKNGDKRAKLKVADNAVEIPERLIFGGYLEMRLAMIRNGNTVKELDIEPLRLIEVLEGFKGSQALVDLLEQYNAVQAELERLRGVILANHERTAEAITTLAEQFDKGKVL